MPEPEQMSEEEAQRMMMPGRVADPGQDEADPSLPMDDEPSPSADDQPVADDSLLSEDALDKMVLVERSGNRQVKRPLREVLQANRSLNQSSYRLSEENKRLQRELQELRNQRPTRPGVTEQQTPTAEPGAYEDWVGQQVLTHPELKKLKATVGLLAKTTLEQRRMETQRREQEITDNGVQTLHNHITKQLPLLAKEIANEPMIQEQVVLRLRDIYNAEDYGNDIFTAANDAIRDVREVKLNYIRNAAKQRMDVTTQKVDQNKGAGAVGPGGETPVAKPRLPTSAADQERYLIEKLHKVFK